MSEIIPDRNAPVECRRTALITGASAGIGAALAREYAARGSDLVLVARRRERLEALAKELRDLHGCRIVVAPADLADPAMPEALEAAVRAAGLEIDVLVNNAGYAISGAYLSSPWEQHAAMLQVMIGAVAELTYRFLPPMLERGTGRILNVASIAGLLPPTAGHTLYHAVKAWMVRFSEALAFEYGEQGVRTTAVCPGFTYSEFHDVSGTRELVAKLPKRYWMDADTVAEQAVDASERGEVVYVNGWRNQLLTTLANRLPRPWLYGMIRRRAKHFRRED